LRGRGVSPPDCLNYHLIARRRLTRCPSGVCARASRNQFVPDSVHAPYPLRRIRTGRDDQRRRADCLLGLARIQSMRDRCRTQVARSYGYGWRERIPRPDIAGIEKLPDPSINTPSSLPSLIKSRKIVVNLIVVGLLAAPDVTDGFQVVRQIQRPGSDGDVRLIFGVPEKG